MQQAAGSFVQIRELQAKINKELAKLTKNEAAYVTNGAAAGLYLATCAAIQKKCGQSRHYYLSKDQIGQCNVVVFKAHRNPYDFAIQQAGASYKEIGYPNFILPATGEDLEEAIDEHTACLLYTSRPAFCPVIWPSLYATFPFTITRYIPCPSLLASV